jgi:hypothetical protein
MMSRGLSPSLDPPPQASGYLAATALHPPRVVRRGRAGAQLGVEHGLKLPHVGPSHIVLATSWDVIVGGRIIREERGDGGRGGKRREERGRKRKEEEGGGDHIT